MSHMEWIGQSNNEESGDLIRNRIAFCANGYTERIARDSRQMDKGQTRSILYR